MQELSTNRQRDPEPALARRAGKHIEQLYKAQLYRFRRALSHASIPNRPESTGADRRNRNAVRCGGANS